MIIFLNGYACERIVVTMTLEQVKEGELYRVLKLPDKDVRSQAIRFGLTEGSIIQCRSVIPRGPVIIGRNRQEIAIGRGLARRIEIEPVSITSLGHRPGSQGSGAEGRERRGLSRT